MIYKTVTCCTRLAHDLTELSYDFTIINNEDCHINLLDYFWLQTILHSFTKLLYDFARMSNGFGKLSHDFAKLSHDIARLLCGLRIVTWLHKTASWLLHNCHIPG